jgi:putative phosphoribosyl transferase
MNRRSASRSIGEVRGRRFANLADSGLRLGDRLVEEGIGASALALALVPNGVRVARETARRAGLELAGLRVNRSNEGVRVVALPDVSGRSVLVIDDGVETGRVARAVASALRDADASEILLAVPVCPREAMADLSTRYDRIVAVETPVASQPLASYFDDFDIIDEATAERFLAEMYLS